MNQELLAQEGEKLKLDQEPEFKAQLAAARKQLLVARLLGKKRQISQSDAKKYYEAHKDTYSTAQVRVQQILVSDETEARNVLKMARKNPF